MRRQAKFAIFWKEHCLFLLFGAIPLEAMDLVINTLKQELTGAHGDKVVYMIK